VHVAAKPYSSGKGCCGQCERGTRVRSLDYGLILQRSSSGAITLHKAHGLINYYVLRLAS
jgi:hypothetical protein